MSVDRDKRAFALGALLTAALALSGCSSAIVDLPGASTTSDAAHPREADPFLPVHDLPPDRDNVHRGFIDTAMIEREVPDYNDRTFYISGPRSMVMRFQRMLSELGVSRSRIKVDYFPGFA